MRDMGAGWVSPVFARREAELMLLAGACEDAAGGTPRTVLTGAEAGGGKSRLVTEFTATVADRAMVLAGGLCRAGRGRACPTRRSPRPCAGWSGRAAPRRSPGCCLART